MTRRASRAGKPGRRRTNTLDDLLSAAKKQNSPIEEHDIIIVHTGWLKRFFDKGIEGIFPKGVFNEPGLRLQPRAGQVVPRNGDPVGR